MLWFTFITLMVLGCSLLACNFVVLIGYLWVVISVFLSGVGAACAVGL